MLDRALDRNNGQGRVKFNVSRYHQARVEGGQCLGHLWKLGVNGHYTGEVFQES